MALSEEKFFRMRHSWGQIRGQRGLMLKKKAKGFVPHKTPALGKASGAALSYPSHFDPPLHHFSPLLRLQGPIPKTRGDDTVGHAIELRDRGTDGGCQVFFAFLVSLGPDAAQAVVRHHFLKQFLEDKEMGWVSLGKDGVGCEGTEWFVPRAAALTQC